ncbi:hypothetical protein LTT66_06750 [Nocardia gipuzkoensis]|uniref:hypothetical protein n=1 Tax=Nocardia TaxID=1817 RepID=UPI001E3F03EC|nr:MULTISPECIES: hypothetical protein [Nocardia]UGT69871.1 hypothetical protein LTT66_06750 [Nocardia gipuzkoensis]
MTITSADVEQWRYFHRNCFVEGAFRSLDQARFVLNTHSGHGPSCLQYLAASAYSSGLADEALA